MITLNVSEYASENEIKEALNQWLDENYKTEKGMKSLINEIEKIRCGTVYIQREIGNSVQMNHIITPREMFMATLVVDQYVWYSSCKERVKSSFIVKKSRFGNPETMLTMEEFVDHLRKILSGLKDEINSPLHAPKTEGLFGSYGQ